MIRWTSEGRSENDYVPFTVWEFNSSKMSCFHWTDSKERRVCWKFQGLRETVSRLVKQRSFGWFGFSTSRARADRMKIVTLVKVQRWWYTAIGPHGLTRWRQGSFNRIWKFGGVVICARGWRQIHMLAEVGHHLQARRSINHPRWMTRKVQGRWIARSSKRWAKRPYCRIRRRSSLQRRRRRRDCCREWRDTSMEQHSRRRRPRINWQRVREKRWCLGQIRKGGGHWSKIARRRLQWLGRASRQMSSGSMRKRIGKSSMLIEKRILLKLGVGSRST